MHMKGWIVKLNGFLQLNDLEILKDAGKISHVMAKEIAEGEYDKYYKNSLRVPSKADEDFEDFVKSSTKLVKKLSEKVNG